MQACFRLAALCAIVLQLAGCAEQYVAGEENWIIAPSVYNDYHDYAVQHSTAQWGTRLPTEVAVKFGKCFADFVVANTTPQQLKQLDAAARGDSPAPRELREQVFRQWLEASSNFQTGDFHWLASYRPNDIPTFKQYDRFEGAIQSVAALIGINGQRPEKLLDEGPDNLWALSDGSFLVIECKNNAVSEKGISKTDVGQLDQAMTWFAAKYPAATGTALIIHPHRALGDGATAIPGMRVTTEEELKKLCKALEAFAKALSDPDTLNSVKKVSDLVNAHGFGTEFLARYTKAPH